MLENTIIEKIHFKVCDPTLNRNEFVQKRKKTKIVQFSILHHLVSIERGFGMFVRNILLISNAGNVKEKMKNASLSKFYFTNEYDSEHWQHRAQTESTFPFSYILFFKDGNLSGPLAPLWRKIDIYARRLLCTKFNAEQLLF